MVASVRARRNGAETCEMPAVMSSSGARRFRDRRSRSSMPSTSRPSSDALWRRTGSRWSEHRSRRLPEEAVCVGCLSLADRGGYCASVSILGFPVAKLKALLTSWERTKGSAGTVVAGRSFAKRRLHGSPSRGSVEIVFWSYGSGIMSLSLSSACSARSKSATKRFSIGVS